MAISQESKGLGLALALVTSIDALVLKPYWLICRESRSYGLIIYEVFHQDPRDERAVLVPDSLDNSAHIAGIVPGK